MTTQKNKHSVAERINSDVNARVTYKSDLEQYSTPEFWKEAGAFGDCEDYALLKRKLLLNTGVANLGVFTQQIFGGYRPVLVSSNANSCSFKFVNDAGVVQTTLSTAFKFRFTRPHKLPKLMPATQTCYFDCGMALLYWGDIISANGNIWLQGLMHN